MNRWGVLGLVALIIMSLGYWVWDTFTWEPATQWGTPSRAVQADPWAVFVKGVPESCTVSRYADDEGLDFAHFDLVVVRSKDLDPQDPEDWETWVRSGGRLLVVFDGADFEPMGKDWLEREAFQVLNAQLSQAIGVAQAETDSGPLRITVDQTVTIAPAKALSLTYSVDGNLHLAVQSLAKGWVMATGEPVFMENEGLRAPDNRSWTASLIAGAPSPLRVLIPQPLQTESATPSSARSEPLLFSLLGLSILVFSWAWPRLGPILERGNADRLSLRERFLAEGRFLWRHKIRKQLVDVLTPNLPTRDLSSSQDLKSHEFIQVVGRWVAQRTSRKKDSV